MVWGYLIRVQENYIHMYIPVPMMYMCICYFLIMYWYIYGMEITNWYDYKLYTRTYILVPMMYTWRWYLLIMHWYTYGMKLLNDLTKFCVALSTPHTSYKEWKYMWVQIDTIYDLITNVILCHICHIRNGNICRNGKISHEIQINLNHFSFIIHILIHVIIHVTEIWWMNDLIYNDQFDICNHDKTHSCVKPHSFEKRVWIKFNDQELNIWV